MKTLLLYLKPSVLLMLWSQVPNKRMIKIFAGSSFVIWCVFVGLFYFMAGPVSEEADLEAIMEQHQAPQAGSSPAGGTQSESAFAGEAAGSLPPEDLYAHRDLITEYFKSGRFASAIPHLERVSAEFIGDTNFLMQAAELYAGVGNFEKSLKMARRGLELSPNDPRLKASEVMAMYRLNNIEQAQAAARHALQLHPENLELLTVLGTMQTELNAGKPGNAEHLLQALRKNPRYVPARYQLGRKYQTEGNYRDALTQFQKAAEMEPFNGKVRGQLGMAYYYLSRDAEAEREYRTALAINPSDYNTWYNLGELILGRSNKQRDQHIALRRQALECYLTALSHNAEHQKAHFRAGVLLNGNGQFKEALRHLENALALHPNDVRTLVQISVSYENLNLLENARDYLYRAFELDPLNKVVVHKLRYLSQTAGFVEPLG